MASHRGSRAARLMAGRRRGAGRLLAGADEPVRNPKGHRSQAVPDSFRSSPGNVAISFGELSELIGDATRLTERDGRVAKRIPSESGTYVVHRSLQRPAGR